MCESDHFSIWPTTTSSSSTMAASNDRSGVSHRRVRKTSSQLNVKRSSLITARTSIQCQNLSVAFFIVCSMFVSSVFCQQQYSHTLHKRQTLQRFLVEPDNVKLTIGQPVTLPCKVSNKAGILQWTRDGFGLGTDPKPDGFPTYSMVQNEASGDYSLKISSVTLDDDAVFQCQIGASENVPGIRSQSAQLTVQVPPEAPVIVHSGFVNAPSLAASNQQVLSTTAGSKVELICEAYGARPAAELTWLNGKNRVVKKGIESTITLMNDKKRSNAALKWTFEPTKADHGRKLNCRATHPAMENATAASITLEVKFAPEVKLEVSRVPATSPTRHGEQPTASSGSSTGLSSLPASVHGRVGDSLKIKCHADGNPGRDTFVYQWYRADEIIAEAEGRSELFIERVDKHWNGAEVRCQVTNSVGVGKAQVKLNIAHGPEFAPEMQYVYGSSSGENVRLACSVESNPTPEITWIRVGSSSVILGTGPKLTIKNMGVDNVGEYLCRASVKGFPEISAIIYLRLNGPPKIRKGARNSGGNAALLTTRNGVGASVGSSGVNHAVLGESGHVDCFVESVPPPIAITWIHNGQVFTSNSANNLPTSISVREDVVSETPVLTKASFDIRITQPEHFGHYNCVVINKYGSDWHLVELAEQTSFATIASITLISIVALLVVVLFTVIVILATKHRRLIRKQKIQQQMQSNVNDSKLKNAYLDDSDNGLNIYSTTASTRTNSSIEKGKSTSTRPCDGSPRSSSSSFVPYSSMHDVLPDSMVMSAHTHPMNHHGDSDSPHPVHSHHHRHPHSLSGFPHFHTVYSDSPSSFYNPYSVSESPYHFSGPPPPRSISNHHHFSPHVSMSDAHHHHHHHQHPNHMQLSTMHEMNALMNGQPPPLDNIYQANLYQVSPKEQQQQHHQSQHQFAPTQPPVIDDHRHTPSVRSGQTDQTQPPSSPLKLQHDLSLENAINNNSTAMHV